MECGKYIVELVSSGLWGVELRTRFTNSLKRNYKLQVSLFFYAQPRSHTRVNKS